MTKDGEAVEKQQYSTIVLPLLKKKQVEILFYANNIYICTLELKKSTMK